MLAAGVGLGRVRLGRKDDALEPKGLQSITPSQDSRRLRLYPLLTLVSERFNSHGDFQLLGRVSGFRFSDLQSWEVGKGYKIAIELLNDAGLHSDFNPHHYALLDSCLKQGLDVLLLSFSPYADTPDRKG